MTVPPALSTADITALAALPGRIVAAWADHDAAAFADVFLDDGSMVLPGTYKTGRNEIRSFMAQAFAAPYKGTRVTGQPVEVKVLGPDSALLITDSGVLAPGESEVAAERAIRAFWVAVKRDGSWSLAAYQNTPK
jgi:uncharacterized protein (TIGR02246 family)